MLLVIGAIGVSAAQVEDSASLSQFETDSAEAEKLEYVDSYFGTNANTTSVEVVVRDDNVLSRESLLSQLRFERAVRENETVNRTLSASQPPTGIANVVATTAIGEEEAENLTERGRALRAEQRRLNETADRLSDALNRTRSLQQDYAELNRSRASGEIDEETYRERAAAIERNLTATREQATTGLSADQSETFAEGLADGETVEFDGELLLPDYVVPVPGPDAAPVTTDVVGSILAGDRVSERDVADASRHLADGAIDAAAFERVYHAWLDEHASEQSVSDADAGDQAGGTNGQQGGNGQSGPNGESTANGESQSADGPVAPDDREQRTDEHRPDEGGER